MLHKYHICSVTVTDTTVYLLFIHNGNIVSCLQMLVNLFGLSVALEKTTQNTHTTNPNNFLGHTSICGTLTLASTSMAALATCQKVFTNTCSRVYSDRLANDKTVLDQLSYVLSWNWCTLTYLFITYLTTHEDMNININKTVSIDFMHQSLWQDYFTSSS